MDEPNDHQLLCSFQSEHPVTKETDSLFRSRFHDTLIRMARRSGCRLSLTQPADIDDIVQDTYLAILDPKTRRFIPDKANHAGAAYRYLWGLVRNVANSIARARKQAHLSGPAKIIGSGIVRRPVTPERFATLGRDPSAGDQPARRVVDFRTRPVGRDMELRNQVDAVFADQPFDLRRAFEAVHVEGCSRSEVAAHFGTNRFTLWRNFNSLIANARRRFPQALVG
jgi:DNA-directed RNA polymerase specialized sigma24 family protein